jgi:hypothetical protein
VERTGEVDVEHRLPSRGVVPRQLAVDGDGGVGDEDVEAAEVARRLLRRPAHPVPVAQIRHQRQRAHAFRPHEPRRLVQLGAAGEAVAPERGDGVRIGDVEQGDVRALARQLDRGGAADAARGARDQRRLAGERLGGGALRRGGRAGRGGGQAEGGGGEDGAALGHGGFPAFRAPCNARAAFPSLPERPLPTGIRDGPPGPPRASRA